jgi:hypothetical protein
MKPILRKNIAVISLAVTVALAGTARAAPPPPATERLTFMGGGVDWDGAQDGGGGAIGWLHNFGSGAILGLAAEHQRLGDTSWTFGTVSFASGFGSAQRRSNIYLEVRQGGGDEPSHSFTYSTYIVGLVQNVTHQLAFQLEDKQIDINQSHGNLPRVGVQFLWSPKLLTQVAYARSTDSGRSTTSSSRGLGTRLWTARADYYGKWANLFVGGATGQSSPVVFEQGDHLPIPDTGLTTHESYLGVTKPFSRVDVTLMGDYLKLGDFKRKMVTLSGSIYLNGSAIR